MKHIKFNPWTGSNYRQAPLGKRILILGESHYDFDPDQPIEGYAELTNECIQEQIDGDTKKAFWTKIATTFLNRTPMLEDKRTFWHSVAFYNYVQSTAGSGPRKRPSGEQWTASESAFFEVLDLLEPQLVVVLGYTNWENLTNTDAEEGPGLPHFPHVRTCRYRYSTGSCLAIRLLHPSSGFSPSDWNAPVFDAITSA